MCFIIDKRNPKECADIERRGPVFSRTLIQTFNRLEAFTRLEASMNGLPIG